LLVGSWWLSRTSTLERPGGLAYCGRTNSRATSTGHAEQTKCVMPGQQALEMPNARTRSILFGSSAKRGCHKDGASGGRGPWCG
jgi:hypothetical protein